MRDGTQEFYPSLEYIHVLQAGKEPSEELFAKALVDLSASSLIRASIPKSVDDRSKVNIIRKVISYIVKDHYATFKQLMFDKGKITEFHHFLDQMVRDIHGSISGDEYDDDFDFNPDRSERGPSPKGRRRNPSDDYDF